jgi:hypothetical protein
MPLYSSFDIACLGSKELLKLYGEVNSYAEDIRIEVLASRRSHRIEEEHPATTLGLTHQKPTIRIVDSLDRGHRIEAIAHELAHLLLVYRHGLGVIGRRIPRCGDSEDVFRFFMSMRGDWVYLLGQIANTVHHLILVNYLKKEYGIQSSLHLRLLQHNFGIAANDHYKDKESLYAKGLIAFECERLIGRIDRVMDIFRQAESFWEAYHSAQKYFGTYSFQSIPTPNGYEEDILSFLQNLGYPREDFIFFPERKKGEA